MFYLHMMGEGVLDTRVYEPLMRMMLHEDNPLTGRICCDSDGAMLSDVEAYRKTQLSLKEGESMIALRYCCEQRHLR